MFDESLNQLASHAQRLAQRFTPMFEGKRNLMYLVSWHRVVAALPWKGAKGPTPHGPRYDLIGRPRMIPCGMERRELLSFFVTETFGNKL